MFCTPPREVQCNFWLSPSWPFWLKEGGIRDHKVVILYSPLRSLNVGVISVWQLPPLCAFKWLPGPRTPRKYTRVQGPRGSCRRLPTCAAHRSRIAAREAPHVPASAQSTGGDAEEGTPTLGLYLGRGTPRARVTKYIFQITEILELLRKLFKRSNFVESASFQ